MQTREDRIYLHYRSLKKRVHEDSDGLSMMWMTLARTWEMPIRELKALIKKKKARVD